MKKRYLLMILCILSLSLNVFSLPLLNPSPEIVDEGNMQLELVSYGNIAIRYGLFGFMEVGASENEGNGYLKMGLKNISGVPFNIALSYGYIYGDNNYILNGVFGYTGEKIRISGGAAFSKNEDYDYEKDKSITNYELDPFMAVTMKIDDRSAVNFETNLPISLGDSGTNYGLPVISIYGTQKYDNVFFFKYIGIYGGIKYDFGTVKILFGVSSNIEFFKSK
ncbi:hypothetical protein [Marinitoga lauensis]|uniref:hypothetical protein n=1 Tax=Marinitoga lauensis TaxID=2201189 RepID=UPI00101385FF|nr:hypothetical protein [Marinitoga lauensis]